MKGLYKYKVTIYDNYDEKERVYNGIVYSENFGDAVNRVVKSYEYYGEQTKTYDTEICEITVSPVLNNEGDIDDLYQFEN